jgi:hypothetical protein
MSKGNDKDNIIFSIANQIKHGIGNLAEENCELRIDIAILFWLAGTKAVACSDYVTS